MPSSSPLCHGAFYTNTLHIISVSGNTENMQLAITRIKKNMFKVHCTTILLCRSTALTKLKKMYTLDVALYAVVRAVTQIRICKMCIINACHTAWYTYGMETQKIKRKKGIMSILPFYFHWLTNISPLPCWECDCTHIEQDKSSRNNAILPNFEEHTDTMSCITLQLF